MKKKTKHECACDLKTFQLMCQYFMQLAALALG